MIRQMKLIPLFMLMIASTTFFACKKTNNNITRTYAGRHTGKILYNTCGDMVIQATDGTGIGQYGWTDSNNTTLPVYNNVFKVANPVQFSSVDTTHISIGDIVNFQFTTPITDIYLWCIQTVKTPDTIYVVQRVP